MRYPAAELIWEGRIHIGDDPGTFGDASYTGLAGEFPITVYRSDGTGAPADPVLAITAEHVKYYGNGYDGHVVTVTGYREGPAERYHWVEFPIAAARLTADRLEMQLPLGSLPAPIHLSVRVRGDTEITLNENPDRTSALGSLHRREVVPHPIEQPICGSPGSTT
jgi:hypothetical protein